MGFFKKLFGIAVAAIAVVGIVASGGLGAGAAGFFGAGTASFFGTIGGRLLTAVALTLAQRAFAPKVKGAEGPGIRTDNVLAGETNPLSFMVGLYATAGTESYPRMTHDANRYLTMRRDLSDIRGITLERVAINGAWVDIDTVSAEHPDYGTPLTGDHAGKAWVKFYDGSQTVADPMMIAKYGDHPDYPYTTSMIGFGVAYAILTFRGDQALYPSHPTVLFELGGIPVYDPRADTSVGGSGAQRWDDKTTWAQSRNPKIITYNIKRGIDLPDGSIWGGRVEQDDLPLADWFASMNDCDESVLLGEAMGPRYQCGYEIMVSDEPASVIEELDKACSGAVADIGGRWYPRAGAPGLPVLSITDGDLLSLEPVGYDPHSGLEAGSNAINVSFPDPAQLYQPREAPPLTNAEWEAEDGGQRLINEINLPTVPFADRAQLIQKELHADDRRQARHLIDLPRYVAHARPLEVIDWTSDYFGHDGKDFEIAAYTIDLLTFNVQRALREVNPADFTPPTIIIQDVPPPVRLVPAPLVAPGIRLSTDVRTVSQQPVGVLIIDVDWVAATGDTAEVQYRRSADVIWRDVGSSQAGRFEVSGVEAVDYDVRVRAVSTVTDASDWVEVLGWPVALPGLPPQDVAGFDVAIVGAVAHFSWDPVPDEDLSHYIIRWSPDTSGASYSNAITVVPKVPRPGTSVTSPARTGTYFIRAVDKLGNASLNPSAIITTVAGVEGLNAVEVVTENPAFTGAEVWFTDVPGLFSASSGLFSDGGGVINDTSVSGLGLVLSDYSAPGSGIYKFRGTIDLGTRYTSRLTASVSIARQDDTAGLFSAAPGLFSARSGLFTGGANFSDVHVATEVATSDDMIAWSAWRPLSVGDFTARGFKFRAILSTDTANVTPFITALSVTVDMPDRVIAEADILADAAGSVIAFSPALRGLAGLGISPQGLASGDFYTITGKSAAGFTIQFKNAAGTGVARTFDYVARGYGVSA